MPRPGTDVTIVDATAPGGPSLNTGQAFFVGKTASGPTDAYGEVHSLKQYTTDYGARTGGEAMHDAANAFFQEGGGTLFVAARRARPRRAPGVARRSRCSRTSSGRARCARPD
jgi:hypothetical protein